MEGKKGESPAENRRVGIFVHILFFIKVQIIIPQRMKISDENVAIIVPPH